MEKANGYGAVAAMLGGIAVRVGLCGIINGFTMQSIAKPDTTWFYFTVAGPVVSLICMLTVSLLTHSAPCVDGLWKKNRLKNGAKARLQLM